MKMIKTYNRKRKEGRKNERSIETDRIMLVPVCALVKTKMET